jgi:hypothetical protein
MTDYINQKFPVSDADADGLYPWLAVRSGADENVIANLRVTRPINVGQRFLYNQLAQVSGAFHKYGNTIVAPVGANQPIVTTPLLVENQPVVECQVAGSCVVDPTLLTITNATGAPVNMKCYLRVVFTGYAPLPLPPVDGDQILIGFSINGAVPVLGANVAVNQVVLSQNGVPSVVVIQNNALAVPSGETLSIRYSNTTEPLRGISVKEYQLIVAYP